MTDRDPALANVPLATASAAGNDGDNDGDNDNDNDTAYDAANDLFVRALRCPHVGCGALAPLVNDDDDALALCEACGRPFEIVRVPAGEGAGAYNLQIARRARLRCCSTTGQLLQRTSLLDWSGAGGSPARAGALPDRRGLVFGEPTRDIEWDLAAGWSQAHWGVKDAPRPDEIVTSVSVFRGVVVAVSAQGLVGLFHVDDGRPLLEHPLSWPGVDIDDDDHARAVRLPPTFHATTMIMTTDRTALFRDLSSSLFPAAKRSTASLFTEVQPTAPPAASASVAGLARQFVGPALVCDDDDDVNGGPRVLLVEAAIKAGGNTDDAAIRVFDLAGRELGRVDTPMIARPPAWDPGSNRALWVNTLGHVFSLDINTMKVATALPGEMLTLQPGERAHLVTAPDSAGSAELWLADDAGGSVRVWRAPIARVLDGRADWSWEVMFEHKDTGALRGMSVGFGSRDRKNIASQYLVLSTEKSTAALSRAVKGTASDAVLQRAPIAPPILTSVGFLTQDKRGMWLRALPPWAFRDKNPERHLPPPVAEGRPAFYDRTFAIHGRQVFYAHGGRIHEAKLRSRRHEVGDG